MTASTPALMSNLDAASISMEQDNRIINKVSGIKNCLMSSIIERMIILLLIIFPTMAFATDFGIAGQTFKIVEEPFIEMLKKRLDKVDMEKEKEKIQRRARDQVENPAPVKNINPATKHRIFYFDPSYTLDKDAVLPCGKILHKAGTSVNPLEHMDLNRRMFFIDGRNQDQVAWIKDQLQNPLPKQNNQIIEDRVILIGGSVFKLKESLGGDHADKVYFDQSGELTTKFGITGSPAVVMQEGLRLKVEEVVCND